MRRALILVFAAATLAPLLIAATGCSCAVTGGEGDKAVDIDMGGQVVKADFLSFKPVSYDGASLVIRNTADERPLEIGSGTPILDGGGSEVATVTNSVTIDPGDDAALNLDGALAPGGTYYLGEPQGDGDPTLRQLFICPDSAGGGGAGGYDIPEVQDPEITE